MTRIEHVVVALLLALPGCRPSSPAAASLAPPVARPPVAKTLDPCPLPADEKKSATRDDMIGAKVAGVCFRGRERLSEATLAGTLDSKVGGTFHPDIVRRDIQSLFARGGVDDVEVHASLTPRGVVLVYTVRERRPVVVEIVGGESLTPDERRAATDVGAGLDLARVRATADVLAEACQKHGKRATRVTYEITPSGQGSKVTFVVEEGP